MPSLPGDAVSDTERSLGQAGVLQRGRSVRGLRIEEATFAVLYGSCMYACMLAALSIIVSGLDTTPLL